MKNINNKLWFLGAIFWTIVIGSFAWHESKSNHDDIIEHASLEARSNYTKDVLYRRWAAGHGGVYVPVTAQTPQNPYLKNIPERDIETPSGRQLTLLNPAYMTRQVYELAEEEFGPRGHITSLKPLRPENKPDAWETQALQSFENGKTSAKAIKTMGGEKFLRVMFPFVTEEKCLKCHADQGYQVGDIRGGISVSVPLDPYLLEYQATLPNQIAYHAGLWLLGILGLLWSRSKIFRQSLGLESALQQSIEIEQSLRKSRERYQSLVENTDDLITRVDREGRLLYVNSSSLKYWGLPPEECLGQSAFDFICPEDREQTMNQFQNWLQSEESFRTFENRQLHSSGSITNMQWMVASLRDNGGKIVEFSSTARDISEQIKNEETLRVKIDEYETTHKMLLESEERFKALHDASFGGVIIHDQGLILECNQGLSDITGFTNEELIGMDGLKLIAPGSLDLVLQNIKSDYEQRYEVEGVRKDGSIYPLFIRGKKVIYKGSEVRVVEFQDVTELKQAEQEKEILEAQLHQAHKMEAVGTMAGGIAHDFNNLLSIISGNIDIIKHKQNTDSQPKENIEHIKNATLRAAGLVKQILAFSRQEKPNLVQVDVTSTINEALNLLRSTIPATIEIMTTVASGPVVINADTTQLQQVLINLCSNAAQAMNEKGLLRIRLEEVELAAGELPAGTDRPAGKYVKLSISDTGSGMDKATVDRIFDPFFTTKERGEGTGMGLSVVHGIVEQHGGFISVNSELEMGTTFNVYFPVTGEVAAEQKTEIAETLPTGSERILFVDDEECIAYTCNELLECQGYRVTSVTSSFEALDIFKASPEEFDLVFTDQTMPEMSGAELAIELLKIRPDIPIILCSGFSAKVTEEDAKNIGIREFCMKPMDMKQLALVARRVLDENSKVS